MKKIKRLLAVALLISPLLGCQMERNNSSIDKPTPHSVAINYLFVHGMCVGYLQDPSVTKAQFTALAQLDQEAKLSIIKVLTQPTTTNLEQAQYLMQQIIAFITSNQKEQL